MYSFKPESEKIFFSIKFEFNYLIPFTCLDLTFYSQNKLLRLNQQSKV